MRHVRLNRFAWFRSAVIILILVLATLPALADDSEFSGSLPNTDFETGDRQGWTGYGCRVEIITNDVYQGRYACKAWLDQEWGGGLFTTFRAPKGRYQVTMHVKTSPDIAGRCFAGADKFGGKVDQAIQESNRWVEISFEVRVRNPICEIHVWGPKIANSWIILDEVKVVPIS